MFNRPGIPIYRTIAAARSLLLTLNYHFLLLCPFKHIIPVFSGSTFEKHFTLAHIIMFYSDLTA